MQRVLTVLLIFCSIGLAQAAAPEKPPLVFGQSLPLTGPGFPIANRVLAGAKALVERVNANGGIQGHPVELLTLDDAGDPLRTAQNVRTLVRERGAMAIVNCLGELACRSAADATSKLEVPLVGPLSGAETFRGPSMAHVFLLRVESDREARALASQMRTQSIRTAVVLGDGAEPTAEDALLRAMNAGNIEARHMRVQGAALEETLRALALQKPDALLLSLGPGNLDRLNRLGASVQASMPPFVASLSVPGLTQVTRMFKGAIVVFTTVVPIPENAPVALMREFETDVDAFGGPEAVSFEGFSGYLHMRLVTEALLKSGAREGKGALEAAIEALGRSQLSGFPVHFSRQRHQGSDFLEVGYRNQQGRLRR